MGWIENCSEALHLCCDRRGGKVEDLTTPSQRRYVQYFSMLLDCVQPRKEAFLLKSLKFTGMQFEGEAPEIQVDVFNCGLLIFATRISIPDDSPSISIVCGRLIRVFPLVDLQSFIHSISKSFNHSFYSIILSFSHSHLSHL